MLTPVPMMIVTLLLEEPTILAVEEIDVTWNPSIGSSRMVTEDPSRAVAGTGTQCGSSEVPAVTLTGSRRPPTVK